MKQDYKQLDKAIIKRISVGNASFTTICNAVRNISIELEKTDTAEGFRIVDRRLQALRKAGRIKFQGIKVGWVIA